MSFNLSLSLSLSLPPPPLPLSRKEIEEWSKVMVERIKDLKPLIVCFNGKGTYERFLGDKCDWGLQSDPIPGTNTVIWLLI